MATPVITPIAHFINNCPDRDVYAFFHKVIDVCCDKTHSSKQNFVSNHLNDPIFVDKFVSSVWPTESVFQDVVLQFVQLVYFLGCQMNNVEKSIENLSFEEKTKLILQECLKVRQKELFKAIVFKTITLNVPYLKTYNWQVKVVMSSDRLQNVKVPILQLDLVFESPNSKVNNSVPFNNKLSFELTKEELGTLVQTLEDAKQNLVQALAI